MKRPLELFLGALAVGAAVATLARARQETASPSSAAAAPEARDEQAAGRPRALEMLASTEAFANASARTQQVALSAGGIALGLPERIREHNTVMIAAGLSYYALLALFPAAIAAVSIYGLVADPAALERQVADLASALPQATATFVTDQLRTIVNSSSASLGVASVISILAALWSASAGTKALIKAITIAYDEEESRSYLVLRLLSYATTIGIIVFVVGAVAATTLLPRLLDAAGLADDAVTWISVLQWPALLFVVVVGLGALYKLAPNRPMRMTRWISLGAVIAAAVWVLATLGLNVYVANAGNLGETYGAFTGLIVLMLWFFISGLVVLVGAELNHSLEKRRRD